MKKRDRPSSKIAARFAALGDDDDRPQAPTPYPSVDRITSYSHCERNERKEMKKRDKPSSKIAARLTALRDDDDRPQAPTPYPSVDRTTPYSHYERNERKESVSKKQKRPSSKMAARFEKLAEENEALPQAPTPYPGIERKATYHNMELKESAERKKRDRSASKTVNRLSSLVDDEPFRPKNPTPTHKKEINVSDDLDNRAEARIIGQPVVIHVAPRPEFTPHPPVTQMTQRTRIIQVVPNPSDTQLPVHPRKTDVAPRPPAQPKLTYTDGTPGTQDQPKACYTNMGAQGSAAIQSHNSMHPRAFDVAPHQSGQRGPIVINVAPQPPTFPPRPPFAPRPPVEPKPPARPHTKLLEMRQHSQAVPKIDLSFATLETVEEEEEPASPRQPVNAVIAHVQSEVPGPSDRSRKFGMTYLEKAYGRTGFHLPDIKDNDTTVGRNITKAMPQKPALISLDNLTENNGSHKPTVKLPALISKSRQPMRPTEPYPGQRPTQAPEPIPREGPMRVTEPYPNHGPMRVTEPYPSHGPMRATEPYPSQGPMRATEPYPSHGPMRATEQHPSQGHMRATEPYHNNDPMRTTEPYPKHGPMRATEPYSMLDTDPYPRQGPIRAPEPYPSHGKVSNWSYQLSPRPPWKSTVEQLPVLGEQTALTYQKSPPELQKASNVGVVTHKANNTERSRRSRRAVSPRPSNTATAQVADASVQTTSLHRKLSPRTSNALRAAVEHKIRRETIATGYEQLPSMKQQTEVDKIPPVNQPSWVPVTLSRSQRKTSVVVPLPHIPMDTSPYVSPRDQGDTAELIPRAQTILKTCYESDEKDDEDEDGRDVNDSTRFGDITIERDGTMLVGLEDVHISPSELSYISTPSPLRAPRHPPSPASIPTPRLPGDGQDGGDMDTTTCELYFCRDVDTPSEEEMNIVQRETAFTQQMVTLEEKREVENQDLKTELMYTIETAKYNTIVKDPLKEAEEKKFREHLLNKNMMPHKPKPPHHLGSHFVTGPFNVEIAPGSHINDHPAGATKSKQPPASLRKRRQPKYRKEN